MSTNNIEQNYTTGTSRLRLRRLQGSDLSDFHTIWSNPNATQWTSYGVCRTLEESKVWLDILSPSAEKPEPQNYGVFLRDPSSAVNTQLPRPVYYAADRDPGQQPPRSQLHYQSSEYLRDSLYAEDRCTPEPCTDRSAVRLFYKTKSRITLYAKDQYTPEPCTDRSAVKVYYKMKMSTLCAKDQYTPETCTDRSAVRVYYREKMLDTWGAPQINEGSTNNTGSTAQESSLKTKYTQSGDFAFADQYPGINRYQTPLTKMAQPPSETIDTTNSRNRMIGIVGVFRSTSEVGYIFDEAFWGQGYASEALAAFLEIYWGRAKLDPTISRVISARVDPKNPASVKVLRKSGFKDVVGNKESGGKDILHLQIERVV